MMSGQGDPAVPRRVRDGARAQSRSLTVTLCHKHRTPPNRDAARQTARRSRCSGRVKPGRKGSIRSYLLRISAKSLCLSRRWVDYNFDLRDAVSWEAALPGVLPNHLLVRRYVHTINLFIDDVALDPLDLGAHFI